MKLAITKLKFCLDFLSATEKLEAKLGKDFCEKEGLETAEDLIDFNAVVGNWKNPEAILILIKRQPWIIPLQEFEEWGENETDSNSTDLVDDCKLVVFRYIGKDEELLKTIMKNITKITGIR